MAHLACDLGRMRFSRLLVVPMLITSVRGRNQGNYLDFVSYFAMHTVTEAQ